MLFLSYLSGCVHHQDTMLEEEYGHGAQVPQVVPQVLIVRANEDLGLILLADKIPDALIGTHDSSGVFA